MVRQILRDEVGIPFPGNKEIVFKKFCSSQNLDAIGDQGLSAILFLVVTVEPI